MNGVSSHPLRCAGRHRTQRGAVHATGPAVVAGGGGEVLLHARGEGVRGPFRDLSWTFPRYYTLAAREFVEEVRELDGALPVEPPAVAIGFSGPLLVDVSFARSGDNMRTAAAACREAVRRWLGWKRVAMDRAARQGQRDPADTSGTVGWCRVAGARRRSRRDCAEIAPRLCVGRALAGFGRAAGRDETRHRSFLPLRRRWEGGREHLFTPRA